MIMIRGLSTNKPDSTHKKPGTSILCLILGVVLLPAPTEKSDLIEKPGGGKKARQALSAHTFFFPFFLSSIFSIHNDPEYEREKKTEAEEAVE